MTRPSARAVTPTVTPTVTATVTAALTLVGRGRLPYADLNGEPLVAHALRSLTELSSAAGLPRPVVLLDPGGSAEARAAIGDRQATLLECGPTYDAPGGLLLHDPLCPLVDAAFLGRVLAEGSSAGEAAVAFGPVTDTVKTVAGGRIAGTVDRDGLAALVSPVFVPAALAAAGVPVGGFAALAGWLRERGPLKLVEAPALARRVGDESAVSLLACLSQ